MQKHHFLHDHALQQPQPRDTEVPRAPKQPDLEQTALALEARKGAALFRHLGEITILIAGTTLGLGVKAMYDHWGTPLDVSQLPSMYGILYKIAYGIQVLKENCTPYAVGVGASVGAWITLRQWEREAIEAADDISIQTEGNNESMLTPEWQIGAVEPQQSEQEPDSMLTDYAALGMPPYTNGYQPQAPSINTGVQLPNPADM